MKQSKHTMSHIVLVLTLLYTVNCAPIVNIGAPSWFSEIQGVIQLAAEYNNVTGSQIHIVSLDDIASQMLTDLRSGSPFYDGFIFQGGDLRGKAMICSACQPDQAPLFATLNELVREDENINWQDINPFQRLVNSVYQGDIYGIPLTTDFHVMYYRKDILDLHGIDIPQTWEEFVDVAYRLNGTDMNGDGVPDFGACISLANDTEGGDHNYFLWSVMAPYLQSNGTQAGVFFDPRTMRPLANSRVFQYVAEEIYGKLWQLAPVNQGPTEDIRDPYLQGRCALAYDWADIFYRSFTSNVTAVRNLTGVALAPGTTRVLNRDTNDWQVCTAATCPYMDDKGINRTPFSASLGWIMVASRFAPDERVAQVYQFFSYVSQHSTQFVVNGGTPFITPTRSSQWSPALYTEHGWPEYPATTFCAAYSSSASHPNAALDMVLENGHRYLQASSKWITAYLYGDISAQSAGENIEAEWNSLLAQDGLRAQQVVYDTFIGYPVPDVSVEIFEPTSLVAIYIALCSLGLLCTLALLLFVVKYRHNKILRGTSHRFHYGTMLGTALLFSAVLVFSLPPRTEHCIAALWLVFIGFGTLYGCILVKMFRLHRLKSVKTLQIFRITDAQLLPHVAGVLTPYLVLLAVWTAFDAPQSRVYSTAMSVDQYMHICQTGTVGTTVFVVALGYSCLLLLLGCIYSFLLRNIATVFNESRPVSLSIYIFSFSAVVLIPILFVVPNANIIFIMTGAVLIFSTYVTLVALYLFKVVKVVKGQGDTPRPPSSKHHTQHTYRSSSHDTGSSARMQQLEAEIAQLRRENEELKQHATPAL